MGAAIAFDGLTKQYGSQLALDRLTLTIDQGEIFGFLGPNGAGKTTTIRLLLDLIRPTAGHALILGVDCQADSAGARALTGYLPGDLRLYASLTGGEMVEYTGSLRERAPDRSYITRLAERLELDLSRRISSYSKGNRQKLGLLLSLLDRPPILLWDEPTSGLDPIMQHVVWEIVREETERGATVFFSSHVLSEVDHVCDRVGMLRAGKLIAVEPVAQLKSRALRQLEVTFAGPVPRDLTLPSGTRQVAHSHESVTLETTGDIDQLLKLLARYHVVDLRTEQPSLDDILLTYYGQEAAA